MTSGVFFKTSTGEDSGWCIEAKILVIRFIILFFPPLLYIFEHFCNKNIFKSL